MKLILPFCSYVRAAAPMLGFSHLGNLDSF